MVGLYLKSNPACVTVLAAKSEDYSIKYYATALSIPNFTLHKSVDFAEQFPQKVSLQNEASSSEHRAIKKLHNATILKQIRILEKYFHGRFTETYAKFFSSY